MKRYLLAPGPTPVPERVLAAMSRPMIHHRGAEYATLFHRTRLELRGLFRTDSPVVVLASSGTGGMEAAVANLISAGDEAIVVRGGKFGERWAELVAAYGGKVTPIDVEWGHAVEPRAVADALKRVPGARAVFVQASETSTGVKHPVAEIGALVHQKPECAFVVDAISALGVFDVQSDEWRIDMAVGASQKGLMLPPGLAFVSLSEKARRLMEPTKSSRYYFDLRKELRTQEKDEAAYTPAVSLVVGLGEALTMLREEGLKNVFSRHARLARAARDAARAIGLDLFAETAPTEACTAIRTPAGLDGGAVVRTMRERYGVQIAGGQDRVKGKIFRISHMGYVDRFDLVVALSALEMTLSDLGQKIKLGAAVGAAETVLREG